MRAVDGATAVEPAAVLLPTALGPVKVDVLQIRHVELDQPSDDAGDRLHATAHDLWLRRQQSRSLRWLAQAGADDMSADDLELVAELLENALHRP